MYMLHACMHAPAPPTRLTGGGAHAQYMHSTQYAFSNGIEIGSISVLCVHTRASFPVHGHPEPSVAIPVLAYRIPVT